MLVPAVAFLAASAREVSMLCSNRTQCCYAEGILFSNRLSR